VEPPVVGKKYSVTNLIKSSGLLPDIGLLISAWDESKSVDENFDAAIRQNVFGKASRKRVADMLKVFRQRYLPNDGSDQAFRIFIGSSLPSEVTDRVVYYYTALAEPALYDFVTDYLYPLYLRGERSVMIRQALEFLAEATREGRTVGKWESENTRKRVAQGLLSTLRDFGLLTGVVGSTEKTLAPARLPTLAFAFIAFYLKRGEPSGERLVQHRHWRLFFLGPQEVEHAFAEAAAEKLLIYQAAGSIIRIELPTTDFLEYAHALVGRTF
jgi:Putative inner membrane protein (DUF1819)